MGAVFFVHFLLFTFRGVGGGGCFCLFSTAVDAYFCFFCEGGGAIDATER